jgi:hypothetical protein
MCRTSTSIIMAYLACLEETSGNAALQDHSAAATAARVRLRSHNKSIITKLAPAVRRRRLLPPRQRIQKVDVLLLVSVGQLQLQRWLAPRPGCRSLRLLAAGGSSRALCRRDGHLARASENSCPRVKAHGEKPNSGVPASEG